MSGRKRGVKRRGGKQADASKRKLRMDASNDVEEVVELDSMRDHAADKEKGECDSIGSYIDFEKLLASPAANIKFNVGCSPADPSKNIFEISANNEVEAMKCSGDGIAAHIPQQICQKIWQGKYVNLACLLKSGSELSDMYEKGGSQRVNEKGELEAKTRTIKEKITSVEKWSDAFLIFMHIFLQKHSGKALELIEYMALIREVASRQPGVGWRIYDEQFLLRLESQPRAWNQINPDLWFRVLSLPQHPSRPAATSTVTASTLRCLDFNNGICRWTPCKYAHICSNCSSSEHGRWSCPNANKPNFRAVQPSSNHMFRGASRGFGRYIGRRGSFKQN